MLDPPNSTFVSLRVGDVHHHVVRMVKGAREISPMAE